MIVYRTYACQIKVTSPLLPIYRTWVLSAAVMSNELLIHPLFKSFLLIRGIFNYGHNMDIIKSTRCNSGVIAMKRSLDRTRAHNLTVDGQDVPQYLR